MRAAEPAEAFKQAASLDPGKLRTEMLTRATAAWVRQDPESALTGVRGLPTGAERDQIATDVASGFRNSDPVRAAEWLELISNAEARGRGIEEVVGDWARKNPAAALEWVDKRSDEADLARGRYGVGRGWAFTDLNATSDWIATLAAGPGRESAIMGFISVADGYNPSLATRWASAMTDTKERDKQLRYTFGRWIEKDVTGAKAWLNEAKLDDSTRAAFIRVVENPSLARSLVQP